MIPVGHKVKKKYGRRKKKIQGTTINFQPDSLVCMNLALINQNLLRLLHNSGMQLCREDKTVTRIIMAPRPPQQRTFVQKRNSGMALQAGLCVPGKLCKVL